MSRYPTDPDFEPSVADWLEADPDIAPSPVLSTVLAAFPSILQRRASRVPRRFQTMNRIALFGAATAIVVAATVGGLLIASRTDSRVAGAPPPTPAPSQIIPDGVYLGTPQPVAGILARLADDPTLAQSERDAIIDTILGIRGGTRSERRWRSAGISGS